MALNKVSTDKMVAQVEPKKEVPMLNQYGYISSPYLQQYYKDQIAAANDKRINAYGAGTMSPAEVGLEYAANKGREKGVETFISDPMMINTSERLQDLSRGYSGKELGALRGESKANIAGNRNAYLSALSGKLARGGVGGARAAAISAAADKGFNQNVAADERKATLDNANLIRSGTKDATDFLMRQKYGVLGRELAEQQLAANAQSNEAAAEANKKGPAGPLEKLLDPSWYLSGGATGEILKGFKL